MVTPCAGGCGGGRGSAGGREVPDLRQGVRQGQHQVPRAPGLQHTHCVYQLDVSSPSLTLHLSYAVRAEEAGGGGEEGEGGGGGGGQGEGAYIHGPHR